MSELAKPRWFLNNAKGSKPPDPFILGKIFIIFLIDFERASPSNRSNYNKRSDEIKS